MAELHHIKLGLASLNTKHMRIWDKQRWHLPTQICLLRLDWACWRLLGLCHPSSSSLKEQSWPRGMICSAQPHTTCLSTGSAFLFCAHNSEGSQLHLCVHLCLSQLLCPHEHQAALNYSRADTAQQGHSVFHQILWRDYTSSVLHRRGCFQAGWGFRKALIQRRGSLGSAALISSPASILARGSRFGKHSKATLQ